MLRRSGPRIIFLFTPEIKFKADNASIHLSSILLIQFRVMLSSEHFTESTGHEVANSTDVCKCDFLKSLTDILIYIYTPSSSPRGVLSPE